MHIYSSHKASETCIPIFVGVFIEGGVKDEVEIMKTFVAAAVCSLVGSAAFAQGHDWQYSLTTYIWASDTGVRAETPSGGTVETTLSFSDALQDLDFAFAGTFEARKGRLSFFTDASYVKLSTGNSTPGPASNEVNVRTEMTFVSAFAAYRAYEAPAFAVDLAGGFRWTNLSTDVEIIGGTLDGDDFVSGDTWIEPVVGVRMSAKLSEKLSAVVFADIGGFEQDSSTWQALATLNYALNDRWSLVGGYRYMEFERIVDGKDIQMDLSGIVLAATYKF